MTKPLNILIIKYQNIFKQYFYIFTIIFFIQIKYYSCDNCKTNNIITNTGCFNNILIFNSKTYRAGHFAKNKKGDIIIEYSIDSSRLFFGLKQNGEYYFSGETHTKEIENIGSDDGASNRYESNNIFVSLEDDINKNNEYLFSTSSYGSLTELLDLDNSNYKVRKTENFMGYEIFSFQFPILETTYNNKNIYFCAYFHAFEGYKGYNIT